ncbi:DNA-binding NarL/FixJ family response regulator [Pseudomonas psychrotolerans]|nr:DNA-binding NarL/FixJ family response regulator [Pseudomonas psychrotolerans]
MTPIRIVLVDDHALVRAGVRALLGTIERFAVVGEASSGEEALDLLERLDPDILLVDIGLKDMNGLELTAQIAERAPRARVLILSMYDNREYVSTSLRVGAAGYVLKDAPSEEIIAAVEALAVGGRFYSDSIAARLGEGGGQRTRTHATRAPGAGIDGPGLQQQGHGPAPAAQRAHGGNPSPEHPAQAGYPEAGRSGPPCPPIRLARGGIGQRLTIEPLLASRRPTSRLALAPPGAARYPRSRSR